jgi:hypothetical protein
MGSVQDKGSAERNLQVRARAAGSVGFAAIRVKPMRKRVLARTCAKCSLHSLSCTEHRQQLGATLLLLLPTLPA